MTEEPIKKLQKKLKCSSCGELFDREILILRSGKKYCEACLEAHIARIKENRSDWDTLFEYICELYKIERPTGMMFKQMKEYRSEDYGYTDIGMYYTLKYYYGIMENSILENSGVGIIPYQYERAKQYYNKVFDLQDKAMEFVNEEKTIKINTKVTHKEINKIKLLPLNLEWEDENDKD